MYDDDFSTDWEDDDLDREEAVWRAYALGVAAALGDRHASEYRRLVAAAGRPLVEMAYDEGKTSAADLDSRIASGTTDVDDHEFPSRERAVWSKLVTHRGTSGGDIEATDDSRDRADLPAFLYRIDLGSTDSDDLDRLRFPDFLSRK